MTVQTLLFLLVVFLSNIVQCVTGFAGTVLAMPFSVMLVGIDTAKPILNLLGFAASVGVAGKFHKQINKRELLLILGVCLPGMIAGWFLKNYLSGYGSLLLKLLGVLVILFAAMNFFLFLTKKDVFRKYSAVGWIFLILGGLVHGMFVCGGPLIVSYASVRLRETNELRATLSAVWIVLNGVLLIADIAGGIFGKETLLLSGISLAVLAAALLLGNMIAAKMKRNAFLILTYALMFISGISLLLK